MVYDDSEAQVDEEVRQQLRGLVTFLRKNKVKVAENARPDIDSREAHRNYIQLLRAATSGRMTQEAFKQNLLAFESLKPDDEGYQTQMIRGQAMCHKQWLAHNEVRHRMRLAWADFFRKHNRFLCPTATTQAFPHNQQGERWERMVMVNGKPQPSSTQMFWAGYSCNFYLPSTVAPIELTDDGLPVGVQIVGPQYGDHTCIHFAGLLENEYQGFVPPPGFE
jgi:amidase